MAKHSKKPLSDYDLRFLARTFAAREAAKMTQEQMGMKLGGLPQDTYKQYEVRSPLPHDLVDPFLALTKVSYEYLFTGHADGPAWRERYLHLVEKQSAVKRPKRAA